MIRLVTKCANGHVEFVRSVDCGDGGVIFGSAAHFCQKCEDPLVRGPGDLAPIVLVRYADRRFRVEFASHRLGVERLNFHQRGDVEAWIVAWVKQILGAAVGSDVAYVVEEED